MGHKENIGIPFGFPIVSRLQKNLILQMIETYSVSVENPTQIGFDSIVSRCSTEYGYLNYKDWPVNDPEYMKNHGS